MLTRRYRADTSAAQTGLVGNSPRDRARNAGPRWFRPGNSRAFRRCHPVSPADALFHHSMAMRSGPSARATSWRPCRQRKKHGRPSGTAATAGRDLLRLFEQAQRPARRIAVLRASATMRHRRSKSRSCAGTADAGGFGNMGVLRHETLHPVLRRSAPPAGRSESAICRRAFSLLSKLAVAGWVFFRQQRFQPDQVEAEAGIQRIGQRIQLFVATAAASRSDRATARPAGPRCAAPCHRRGRTPLPAGAAPRPRAPGPRSGFAPGPAARRRWRLR